MHLNNPRRNGMRYSRFAALLVLVIVFASVQLAHAGQIFTDDWVELTAYNSQDNGGIMTYAVSHDGGAHSAFYYETFCIQDNTYITPGVWYRVAGITENVGPSDPSHPGEGALVGAVDYLFYLYSMGRFGSDFTGNAANQADFQRLLWSLQGSGPSYTPVEGTPWQTALANYISDPTLNGRSYGTLVLNLVDSNGYDVQNQLYNVSGVPEPTLILLLGIGLGSASLAAFRKRN
jgi:hypothetical protein